MLTTLGVYILIFQENRSACLRVAVQSPMRTKWVMARIPKPQGQKNESSVQTWDLYKSGNMGTPFQGRTERSLSTNGNWPTRSHAQSPSIGSFQDFSRQLELPMDPRLKLLTYTSKRVQEEKDDGLEVGGLSSLEPKKLLENQADPEGMEDQPFTPRSVENLQKNFGNAKTSLEGPGVEGAIGRGSNHRSRGKSVDMGAMKGLRSPKHRRGVVAKAEVEKPSPKRRRGDQKIMPVEDIEVTSKGSKKTDKFEEGSNEEDSESDSPGADGFEDGEQGNEIEGDEKSPAATKLAGKKVRAGRGGKKPVAERVSVSKVTRAA